MKYAIYEIKQGDDIRHLAQSLLGDLHRWRELVTINQLEYPYISDVPSIQLTRRVLKPGDRLLYPGAPVTRVLPAPAEDAEAEAYGRDVHLTNGYLVPQGGSLALVTGVENLAGALDRRTNTALGGLPAHPKTYGHLAKQYVGAVTGTESLTLLALEFEWCIARDSRVASVETTGAYDGAKLVSLQSRVTPHPPGQVLVLDHTIVRA
jgi:hypothetical protein